MANSPQTCIQSRKSRRHGRDFIIQSTRRLAAQVSGIFAVLFVLITALVWPGVTKSFGSEHN